MDKDQVRIFWTLICGSMLHWCRTLRGLTGDRMAMGYFPGVTLGMSGKFVGDSHDAETTEASERSPPGDVFRELRLVNALRRATVFSSSLGVWSYVSLSIDMQPSLSGRMRSNSGRLHMSVTVAPGCTSTSKLAAKTGARN